ncbi:MAG: flagellar hook-basal body complex protein [Planctomycetota bacterium]
MNNFSAALSGLKANQRHLDLIGDNIANVNTVGYWGARATFKDLYSQVLRPASGPGTNVGGRNNLSIGTGVELASIDMNTAQGSLLSTGRTFDLALRGGGFFVLSDGAQDFYTRAGTFDLDANRNLIDTRTGLRVQSAGGNDIQLPVSDTFAPQATSSLVLEGNLPAEQKGPKTEELTTAEAFAEGTAASTSTASAGPFALADGDQFIVRINGQSRTVTFDAADFADINNATLGEVQAAIDSQIGTSGAEAIINGGGQLEIRTTDRGDDQTIEIRELSGTVAGTLGFTIDTEFQGTQALATDTSDLSSLKSNRDAYVNGDIIRVQGTEADGTSVDVNFVYGVDGTTLGELRDFVTNSFDSATATLDGSGNLILTADESGDAKLSLNFTDDPANTGSTNFNENRMQVTTDGADKDTVSLATQIFDSQGLSHNVTFTFTREQANEWSLSAEFEDDDVSLPDGLVEGLVFDDNGELIGVNGAGAGDPNIEVQFDGITALQTISLEFGSSDETQGLSQFGDDGTVRVHSQDGYAAGDLLEFAVSGDGVIQGLYSNGQVVDFDSIAVASFANPGGLTRQGDTLFSASANSGQLTLGTAALNGASVQAGALEGSNVDLSSEFVRMIEAQRGYQASARLVSIASQISIEAINLLG